MEKASSKLDAVEDLAPEGNGKPLEVHTPGQKTIENVARFLGVNPEQTIKTLIFTAHKYRGEQAPASIRGAVGHQRVMVLLRGDHRLNESKLATFLGPKGWDLFYPTEEDVIEREFNAPIGFLGPVDLKWTPSDVQQEPLIIVLDKALQGRKNLISGANKEDYHLKNVTPEQDFHATAYADLRSVTAGEACTNCGGLLQIDTAVEVGHIFKLGYKYSQSMGARVLDRHGKEVTPIMGSYGIGIERILTASIEQNHDENGFWLPPQIAPFEIVVTPTNTSDEKLLNTAIDIAHRLESAGYEVLLDDRDERPGVKFKDADLVGIPFRVNVGKKVTEGTVEVVQRSTRQMQDASISAITDYFESLAPVR